MVYDEGFAIELGDFSFFAFSLYNIETKPNEIVYSSKCYSTCTGWYLNKHNQKRGCYEAVKLGVDGNLETHIDVYNTILKKKENIKTTNIEFQRTKNLGDKLSYVNTQLLLPVSASFLKHNNMGQIIEEPILNYPAVNNKPPTSQEIKMNNNFNNLKFKQIHLENIKNNIGKHYKTEPYPKFINLNINELNSFAGVNKSRFKQIPIINTIFQPTSEFPVSFNWKHITRPAESQGRLCGSCYTISTLRMIEARLKLLYNHDVKLSVQHVLNCNFYNQGCKGGYPFLVNRYANEFDLLPEECSPYKVTQF
jgi:cathepsin C